MLPGIHFILACASLPLPLQGSPFLGLLETPQVDVSTW